MVVCIKVVSLRPFLSDQINRGTWGVSEALILAFSDLHRQIIVAKKAVQGGQWYRHRDAQLSASLARSLEGLLNWISSLSWWGLLCSKYRAFGSTNLRFNAAIEAAASERKQRSRFCRCCWMKSDVSIGTKCATERFVGVVEKNQ